MKFSESGLPQSKVVEEAFEQGHTFIMSFEAKSMANVQAQVDTIRKTKTAELDSKKASGELSDFKYFEQKSELDDMLDQQLKNAPKLIQEKLEEDFKVIVLNKALELHQHGEQVSDELLAAAMLVESAASSLDRKNIQAKFGDKVYTIVEEAHNIDRFPNDSRYTLETASPDLKRLYSATVISKITETKDKILELRKTVKVVKLAEGQEQVLFDSAKSVWGNDAKMDKRFLEAFNDMAAFADSTYRVSANAKGDLVLSHNSDINSSNDNSVAKANNKKAGPSKGSFKF